MYNKLVIEYVDGKVEEYYIDVISGAKVKDGMLYFWDSEKGSVGVVLAHVRKYSVK